MATTSQGLDRRAQKTRQVIRQAFVEIVRKKGLAGATIQEVTELANVSRGTFYAHYANKYELVDAIVREEFQKAVSAALPADAEWNRNTLHKLIQTLLEYFKNIYQHHRRSRELTPVLEQAMHEELNKVVLGLLQKNKPQEKRSQLSLEAMAQIVSWTIFGAAMQWSQKGNTLSAAQAADEIVVLIMGGVTQLGIEPQDK